MVPRLKERYVKEIVPELMREFGYGNPMEVPKLVKVVLNMGLGDAIQNPKVLENSQKELAAITGQKPVVTRARKSIANFKVRQNMAIGACVTLRRDRMWEFVDRLVSLALPRVRDFRGVPRKGFDGQGNYTMGLKEQIVFPEVEYDKVEKIKGMNITIVTSARTDDEARSLLTHLGMPFRK
jgi:large subunit ribosomal protein L5